MVEGGVPRARCIAENCLGLGEMSGRGRGGAPPRCRGTLLRPGDDTERQELPPKVGGRRVGQKFLRCESLRRVLDLGPEMHDLSAKADAGGLQGRRMVEAMIVAEREPDRLPQLAFAQNGIR